MVRFKRSALAIAFALIVLSSLDVHADDSTVKQAIIRESIASYSGSCPCPYSILLSVFTVSIDNLASSNVYRSIKTAIMLLNTPWLNLLFINTRYLRVNNNGLGRPLCRQIPPRG